MSFAKKIGLYLAVLAVFVATAIMTIPLKKKSLSVNTDKVSVESIEASLGKGLLFGLLGGYRSLISDFVWIKAYVDWENKDISSCISSIELATSIDPYMMMFWTQGASMIAFDTPHWLTDRIPEAQQSDSTLDLFKKRQGKIAISFIDRGLAMFPDNEELLIQKGQMAVAIGDYKLAEKCFGIVATQENSSVYSRRIYASLLEKSGEFEKSNAILDSILSQEPADSALRPQLEAQIEHNNKIINQAKN